MTARAHIEATAKLTNCTLLENNEIWEQNKTINY